MLSRMVKLARMIAAFIRDSESYDLLPEAIMDMEDIHIIVLFRAVDKQLNQGLAVKINESRQMYVSETVWRGEKAVRIAVSSWMVEVESDFELVKRVLTDVASAGGANQ